MWAGNELVGFTQHLGEPATVPLDLDDGRFIHDKVVL